MRYFRSVAIGLALAVPVGCAQVRPVSDPAPTVTAAPVADTSPADPLADYRGSPKFFETYPSPMLSNAAVSCYRSTRNAPACICTVWNLADTLSFEDVKAMGPERASAALKQLYEACELKHPAPLPAATSL